MKEGALCKKEVKIVQFNITHLRSKEREEKKRPEHLVIYLWIEFAQFLCVNICWVCKKDI